MAQQRLHDLAVYFQALVLTRAIHEPVFWELLGVPPFRAHFLTTRYSDPWKKAACFLRHARHTPPACLIGESATGRCRCSSRGRVAVLNVMGG